MKGAEGDFLNEKTDKKVWYKWMELRVHNEVEAIETPTGRIPRYEDLKELFKNVLGKDYTKDDYTEQFTVRVKANLAKIDRIKEVYESKVPDTPKVVFDVLEDQRKRLKGALEKYGEFIPPDKL